VHSGAKTTVTAAVVGTGPGMNVYCARKKVGVEVAVLESWNNADSLVAMLV